MIEIEKPRIECIENSAEASYGKFIVEPLERGYGTTLGNSLRRVLLSSLPGTAVTKIKIAGIQHEFSTIPGVTEDVTEIVLNVKGIIARLHCDTPKTVYIEASGEGEVTAGDIKTDAEVEILNPEHHIATLGPDGSLSMELTVGHGRGYVTAEHNKPAQPIIGTIPVDSIYSPVLKVNYSVENTRVGNQVDYDKLTIEVWTDKTITARDAVSLGAKILCDHFTLFTDLSDAAGGTVTVKEREPQQQDDRGAGPLGPQLQLPQARKHQHRRGPHLENTGRDDQGPQPGPQISRRGRAQARHDGIVPGQRRQQPVNRRK